MVPRAGSTAFLRGGTGNYRGHRDCQDWGPSDLGLDSMFFFICRYRGNSILLGVQPFLFTGQGQVRAAAEIRGCDFFPQAVAQMTRRHL